MLEACVRDAALVEIYDFEWIKVGLTSDEMEYLAINGEKIKKVSRRDLPFILSQKKDGATTVAATMIIAAMAKINIFATGGIGGVHRDINDSLEEYVFSMSL